jgi:hypothetical protein
LYGTIDYGIFYQGRPTLYIVLEIHGFVDVDWVGDMDCRIYTISYLFNLFGGKFSWMRKIQFVVSLSTTKVEYMAVIHVSKGVLWL